MLSRIIAHVSYLVHRFNKERYFRYRNIVIGTEKKYPMFIRQICNFYVASVHKKYCASICTGIDCGARFDGLPILPHDLCGIFIASTARIGKNCTILHHVTIGGNPATFDGTAPISQAATIGDNVIIGAGAKIIGDVKIGNNVRIGAGAVVIHDIPEGCTAVGVPAHNIAPKKNNPADMEKTMIQG